MLKFNKNELLSTINLMKRQIFLEKMKIQKRHIYHHIGIYAFTKEALLRYVSLKRTKNELERKLEQLRALENNMKIHVGLFIFFTFKCGYRGRFRMFKKLMKEKYEKK